MHLLLTCALFLLFSSAAQAQAYYSQQAYVAPQPYAQVPSAAAQPYNTPSAHPPHAVSANPAPATTASPAPSQYEPRPGEYGSSVMTDIRQMNF